MGIDISFLDENGISTKDGIAYTGGEEKYVSAIQRYFKGYEANRKSVEELLESGNTDDYAIKVHSLKSNSRMIGAGKLGDAFEELELAAKAGDSTSISEKTGPALALYEEVINIIRPIGEAETVKAAGEIDAEEARKTADELLTALDDFDDELSAELVDKLRGYPFRITQKNKLKEAAELIGDFMYDEAAELIRQIIPGIE